jgi:dTDP-4-amino-4,6-dideoxygalactose transaminase
MGAVLARSRPVAAAEDAIARWFGRERAVLAGSGTAAIALLLEALGLPRDAQVLYPDTICDTAVNAAVCAGYAPAFADVDADTATLATAPASTVRGKIGAVVPTHIFGHLSAIPRGGEQGLPADCAVIEDAAQGYGGTSQGRKVGALAPFAIVSFGKGKLLDLGSGGALLTDDRSLAQAAEKIRAAWPGPQNSEAERRAFMEACFRGRKQAASPEAWAGERDSLLRQHRHAYVFQIDDDQAARIGAAVATIDRLAEQRRQAAAALQAVVLEAQARWPAQVVAFDTPETAVLWRFTFQVAPARRQPLVESLRRAGLQVSTLFQPMHRPYLQPDDAFPNACALADRLINLAFDGGNAMNAAESLRECLNGQFGN